LIVVSLEEKNGWLSSRRRFFLPIPVLARVLRGKFVAALKHAFGEGQRGFHGQLKPLASPQAFSSFLRLLFRRD